MTVRAARPRASNIGFAIAIDTARSVVDALTGQSI